MMMPKSSLVLDAQESLQGARQGSWPRLSAEVYHLSRDRLVGRFDYPLVIDTPVAVDIVYEGHALTLRGTVEGVSRCHHHYVGTLVWQDTRQQSGLDDVLGGQNPHRPQIAPPPLHADNQRDAPHTADQEQADHPTPSPAPQDQLEQAFLRRKHRGYALLAALVVLLLVGTVWALWQTFFRIYASAPFAAVTVPMRMVTAPESGQLVWNTLVQPSGRVHKGQIIGALSSPKLEEAKARLQNDMAFLRIQIEGLKDKKQDAGLRVSFRQQAAQETLRQKEHRLRAAQAEYDQTKDRQKRLAPLHQKGYLSQIKWGDLQVDVTKAQAGVDEAQAALDQAKTDVQMAIMSLDTAGGRTPQDWDQEISEKLAAYEILLRQRRLLDDRTDGLTLTSPCDCRIVSAQSHQAYVNQGSIVMRLQEDAGEASLIEARLPASVANRVQVGDKAGVALGDRAGDVPARVVDIRPVAATERYGLSPMVMQDPSLTSVYLKPLRGTAGHQEPGTHARVSIDIFPRSVLYRWLPSIALVGTAEAAGDGKRNPDD